MFYFVIIFTNFSVKRKRSNADWSFLKRSRPGVEGYDLPPLTQKLNNNKQPYMRTGGVVSSRNFDTHVTKLENGLTVASEKLFGEFCTVGVIIDAGPRYESTFLNGTTHFLEKLSFNVSYI